jgi:hypothetical protein
MAQVKMILELFVDGVPALDAETLDAQAVE